MRTAVLGAGALGLTAALRLAQRGNRVSVFERESVPGGLAAGFRPAGDSGPWLEKFYHHLFQSDHHAIRLITELGLGAELMADPGFTQVYDGLGATIFSVNIRLVTSSPLAQLW